MSLAVPHWLSGLETRLGLLAEKMDQLLYFQGVIISDQDHLNTVVTALSADFATVIADLQAQPQAAALDFTAADALVASANAQAAALTPAAPVVTDPAPADTSVATA